MVAAGFRIEDSRHGQGRHDFIKLVSSAGTGFFYTTKKNSRTSTEKLSLNKYDPKIRKHVEFKEAKIK